MKLRDTIAKLIETAAIDDKDALTARIADVPDIDLGDQFSPLYDAVGKLIDSRVAHENPVIAERVRTTVIGEFNKAQIHNFKEAGLSESEIEDLAKLEPTERTLAYRDMLENRHKQKYSVTQSEREKELEAKYKAVEEAREKDKLEFDARLRTHEREIEKEQVNHSLNTFVAALPLNTEVFTNQTRVAIAADLIRQKVREYGGELCVVDGKLVARSPKGESLWEGNVQMDLIKIAQKALTEQQLLKAKVENRGTGAPPPMKPEPNKKINRASSAYLKYIKQ